MAFRDPSGQLITHQPAIALHYASSRLWLDLLVTIPFDWLVIAALGLQGSDCVGSSSISGGSSCWVARWVSLLGLLRMGRAYRCARGQVVILNANEECLWLDDCNGYATLA